MKQKEQLITISDIANMAGLNPSTVSRVINHPEMVKDETKKRVQALLIEHNYQPNLLARSLQTKKSGMIALVVPNFTNLSFTKFARGAQVGLQEKGYTMLTFSTHESEEWEKRILSDIARLRLDGAIIMSTTDQLPFMDIIPQTTKIVLIDRDASKEGIDSLYFDYVQAFDTLIKYLKNRNHKKIALLMGGRKSYTGKIREKVYRNAMKKYGLDVKDDFIKEALWSAAEGWKACNSLMQQPEKPTAIIAATDSIAFGVMGYLENINYRIPEQISVIGFNDEPLSNYLYPRLSTMACDQYDLGLDAALTMVSRIEGTQTGVVKRSYKMHLIERNTIGYANISE
ncbi:LacI family DNA-binding transcriptional regulator [Clostridia bacterium]|nr:LacI family DNA-binding transcriptional regulator [Clostridia bacterium]